LSETSLHDAVRLLRSPATIRERCGAITAAASEGRSAHFTLDRAKLPALAQRVAQLTRERFPDLEVPMHSRWRHFSAGGVDRKAELDARLQQSTATGLARARIDLTVVSVLLDAGAGPDWRYHERESGQRFSHSEGLAVASFRAFMAGRFSSDPGDPCRVDAAALLQLDAAALATMLQVDADNPLVGLDGRAALLRRLGLALRAQPQFFTSAGQPGHLFDVLTHHPHAPRLRHHRPAASTQRHQHVGAARILEALLDAFSGIWPVGQMLGNVAVGDVWPHPHAGGVGDSAGLVPFHKLSQWLTYSLVEPFEWSGAHVTGLDELTGLPEYRNGGLLLDSGVIVARDAAFASREHSVADEWVVEWRALTVTLIDELASAVRELLGVSAEQMPLARVLEGGTWAAGRQMAHELRDGAPPVKVRSDGTVF